MAELLKVDEDMTFGISHIKFSVHPTVPRTRKTKGYEEEKWHHRRQLAKGTTFTSVAVQSISTYYTETTQERPWPG